MKRLYLLLILLFGGAVVAEDARVLTHLLAYIGLDYNTAVEKPGVISNQDEYSEMVEFVDSALAEAKKLPELSMDFEFSSSLSRLKNLVNTKAAPEEVALLAKRLEERVAVSCRVRRTPQHWPSLARGEKHYEEKCSRCHGLMGHGDGPAGGSLDPRPADFHDRKRMARITPFNIFNAIRLGVPGTGMASFPLSDEETWDLAFYVQSIRHRSQEANFEDIAVIRPPAKTLHLTLAQLAERSDSELLTELRGSPEEKLGTLISARTYQASENPAEQFVTIALERLSDAEREFNAKNWEAAERFSLSAYLDGVEPIEAQLRARDSAFVPNLELAMSLVRSQIRSHADHESFQLGLKTARSELEAAKKLLSKNGPVGPMIAFLSLGIVLREALEAVLILIALLGVVRTAGAKQAIVSVHLGWLGALLAGLVLWGFSGWVMRMSGVQRELLEGMVTLLAVGVLLYFGFWLHRRTEIGRWRNYLNSVAIQLVEGKRLAGLFGIAFMAVFREAFETVLFLRALSLESHGTEEGWIGLGVMGALALAAFMTIVALQASRKLPVRKLFLISSSLLVVLAVTLVGKGIHAFQEAGYVGITTLPAAVHFELFGIFPTWETLGSQLVIVGLSIGAFLWDRGHPCEPVHQTST